MIYKVADLPSGTVTFLFTDIEGSTRLLQQLGDQYAGLLADQQQILRAACAANNGSVVGSQGDSFFIAFSSALEAIHTAVQSQREINSHTWPDSVSVRVRMGIHTGEPQVNLSNYVGIDVHRAARIAAAAHGGQVLLSQTTYDLVEGDLPEGVTTLDLGEHRLKDLRQTKHLYQLVIDGLPADFPPLKSLGTTANNLPIQLTSFIGRKKEIGEVINLLSRHRLVTLTGPGGSGKTRLALQAAAEVTSQYRDGVFFVSLAPIFDAGLVASTIAQQLGIAETAGQSILDSLKEYLCSKTLLLVLDNFEQVIAAGPLVKELLATCSQIKILVTSREGLHVSGEQTYPVPPLALPDLAQLPPLELLTQYGAVQLFVQRAQAVSPNFQITNETAQVVAEICYRLEGLPLAIELAAARIKLLSPRALLARLGKRLEFLTGGKRDLPERQQTLRNAIAWSYDLLSGAEQQLFRRLSIFVGGCSTVAVEAVAANERSKVPVLDRLGSLLAKSLLREIEGADGEPRFVMLEVLREFGLEQLEKSGEGRRVRLQHAKFYLRTIEQAAKRLDSAEQVEWMNRIEQEHDNLRAALEWSRTAKDAGEICLRLAGSLGFFWEVRGYFSEGRERLSAILSTAFAQGHTTARARLLARAAELAYRQSDYPATTAFAKESLAICRETGVWQGAASALVKLGNSATETGDFSAASSYLEEALGIWREHSDQHGIARALISLGFVALRAGDHQLANRRLEEALVISRELGDTRSMGFELSGLGEVALREGDYPQARRLLEESLELRRQLGNKWGVGVSLGTLGWVAMHENDWPRAISRLGESLEVRREIGDKGGCAWCLERLAEVAMAQNQTEKAARLYGAAAALRASIGSVIDPADQLEHESKCNSLRAALGDEAFTAEWSEGSRLTLERAVGYALGE